MTMSLELLLIKPERAATSSHRGGGASGATEAATVAKHLLLQRLQRLSQAARLTDTTVEDMESAVGLQLTALHAPHAVATVRAGLVPLLAEVRSRGVARQGGQCSPCSTPPWQSPTPSPRRCRDACACVAMLSTVAVPVALRARLPQVSRPAAQAQRSLRAKHAAPLRGAGPGGRSRAGVVVHASGSEAPQVRGCPLQRHR